jgi:glycosyltransferase involved in cell wall biosynthesis
MSIFLDFIRNEVIIKDHNKLIILINSLIDENKRLLSTLPKHVQNGLGTEIFSLRPIKSSQFSGLLDESFVGQLNYNKDIAKLLVIFKELLSTHVSLLGHHNIIDQREQSKLQAKIKEPKLIDSTSILSKDDYINYYDSATYSKKYDSFTTASSTGTIDDLHKELIGALKNLSANSRYFGFK